MRPWCDRKTDPGRRYRGARILFEAADGTGGDDALHALQLSEDVGAGINSDGGSLARAMAQNATCSLQRADRNATRRIAGNGVFNRFRRSVNAAMS